MWTNVLFEEFYWKFRFFSYVESCDAKRNRLRKTKPLLAELNCTNSKWELTVSAALISWILSAHYYHCWLKDRKCTDSHFRLNKKARDVFNCVLMQQYFLSWNTVWFWNTWLLLSYFWTNTIWKKSSILRNNFQEKRGSIH